MADDKRQLILNTKLLVYECEDTESEIKEWFKTINIAGVPLNEQELLNAVYSGPFVTLAKEMFSNSQNANISKWSAYVKGAAIRQDYLACALDWVSKGNVGGYMSQHRHDKQINQLSLRFIDVINWVSSVFTDVESEMRGLEWGRLYDQHHHKPYQAAQVPQDIKALFADPYVKNRRGVFEYILGGSEDKSLLDIRVFDEATKKQVYATQSAKAAAKGASISRCAP